MSPTFTPNFQLTLLLKSPKSNVYVIRDYHPLRSNFSERFLHIVMDQKEFTPHLRLITKKDSV